MELRRQRQVRLVSFALLALLAFGSACGSRVYVSSGRSNQRPDGGASSGQVVIGSESQPVDVAVIFKPGVTDDQLNEFCSDYLERPSTNPNSPHGFDLRPNIQSEDVDYSRRAVYVGLLNDSTAERESIRASVASSAMVSRVAFNVRPRDIDAG
jgi:hypothetical protein